MSSKDPNKARGTELDFEEYWNNQGLGPWGTKLKQNNPDKFTEDFKLWLNYEEPYDRPSIYDRDWV